MKAKKVLTALVAAMVVAGGVVGEASVCIPQISNSIAYAATTSADQTYLKKQLSKKTNQKIFKFYYKDLDKNGSKEAVAITADKKSDLGYVNPTVWYISKKSCKKVYKTSLAVCKNYLCSVKNTCIFVIETTAGGSGSSSVAWKFNSSGAQKLNNTFSGLTFKGSNQFTVIGQAFDYCMDSYGNYTGHTWKKYYMYWNGSKLVEYGGIKISESTLKKASGSTTILNAIKKKGTITSIFYRKNNIININYKTSDGYGGYCYKNVTLKYSNKKVTYYSVNSSGKTALDKATDSGIYKKAISNSVVYPNKFPL